MKKILTSILAFVYLSTSMGATIHLHYCMGKLASWGLIDHVSKNCGQCGMLKQTSPTQSTELKMDCCKDEHKQIKTDNEQKQFPAEFFKYNKTAPAANLNRYPVLNIKTFSSTIEYPNSNAPPLTGNLPLFVLYRNFRL